MVLPASWWRRQEVRRVPARRARVLSRLIEKVRMKVARSVAGSRSRREGFHQCLRSFLGMGLAFVGGAGLIGFGG